MATIYTSPSFQDGPWQESKSQWLWIPPEASRIYVINDTVRGWHLGLASKICNAVVAIEPLDVNATPTATGLLRLCKADGTEVKQLVTITAAQMKTGGVFFLNVVAGAGYVNAAVATGQAGIVKFGVNVTGLCGKGEDPTRPTG